MSNAAAPADRAHPHIVGRIAEDRRRRCPVHQAGEVVGLACVAAQEPVFSQQPQIPSSRCRIRRQRWQDIVRLRPRGGHIRQEQIDLRRLKPGQGDIESLGRQKVDQLAELDRQDFAIPAGLFSDLVVGDQIGALLRRGEMVETDYRHMSKFLKPCGLETSMAGKNHIGVIDEEQG